MMANPDTFTPMEAQLQNLLRPVHPSKKFVQTVRQRINFSPSVKLAEKSPQTRHVLLVLGGVLSASLLIITLVRAVFYLTNRSRA